MARVGLDLKAITDTDTLRLFERSRFWLSKFGLLNFCYLQTFGEFSIKVRKKTINFCKGKTCQTNSLK